MSIDLQPTEWILGEVLLRRKAIGYLDRSEAMTALTAAWSTWSTSQETDDLYALAALAAACIEHMEAGDD